MTTTLMSKEQQETEKLNQYAEEIRSLKEEISILKMEDRGWACSRWQMKCDRQRKALRLLQRRVVNQRLVLSTLDKLGRGLTEEEWDTFRGDKEDVELDKSLLSS